MNEPSTTSHHHSQNKGTCPAEGAQSLLLLHLTAFCDTDLVQSDWDLVGEETTRWNQIETAMQKLLHRLGLEKNSGRLGLESKRTSVSVLM